MKILIICLLFLLSIFLIGQNLNKPFWGEHDWNGVRYGNIARNYLRYGYTNYKLAEIENSGPVEGQKLEAYTHYPPLLPILISISYKMFGVSEWSTRLVAVLATAASIVLIFLIGDLVWNRNTGVLASLIALATPMVLYFGKNASHEPLTLFFILLAFLGYQYGLRERKYGKVLFTVGIILAEMTAWAGYFLVPAITLVLILRKDKKGLKEIAPFWVLSIVIFLIHLTYVFFVTGTISGGNLFKSIAQRSGVLQTAQPGEFNFFNYLLQIRLWFSTLYTLVLMVLSLIWLLNRKIIKMQENDWIVVTLGLVGLIYAAVFSNAVFIHSYLIFYFLPFMAFSGALGIYALKNILPGRFSFSVLALLALVLIFAERRIFVKALADSDADKFAVELGQAINQKTSYSDIVLVSPAKFSYSADNFLKFYGDRRLTYNTNDKNTVAVLVDMEQKKFEIIKK